MPFWKDKKLSEMTKNEWESLCDGCARCCLQKLEDIDSGDIFYTSIACKLLNLETCKCSSYQNRHILVPECIWLTADDAESLNWLPSTCAYRLLANGQDLPSWHHLVSGSLDSVKDAGVSVQSFAMLEQDGDDLEDFIIYEVK